MFTIKSANRIQDRWMKIYRTHNLPSGLAQAAFGSWRMTFRIQTLAIVTFVGLFIIGGLNLLWILDTSRNPWGMIVQSASMLADIFFTVKCFGFRRELIEQMLTYDELLKEHDAALSRLREARP